MLWSVHPLQLLKVLSGIADVDQRSRRSWDGKRDRGDKTKV